MLNSLQICCVVDWQGACKSQPKLSTANGGKKSGLQRPFRVDFSYMLCGMKHILKLSLREKWQIIIIILCQPPFFHETCLISFKSDSKEKFSAKQSTGLKAISESSIDIDDFTRPSPSQETGLKARTCTKGLTNNDSDFVGVLHKFLVVFLCMKACPFITASCEQVQI